MSLTTKDLNAIGEMLDQKLELSFAQFEQKLDRKMDEKLYPIREHLAVVTKDIAVIKEDVNSLRLELQELKLH